MDTALKQRLVGASVLIALAVVVLPMILGGRPDGETQQSQKIELPPQPSELDFETRRYPIGEQPQPRPSASGKKSEPRTLPAPARPTEPLPEPVPDTTAPPADDPADTVTDLAEQATEPDTREAPPEPEVETQPAPAPADDSGRYLVQVASFGAMDNANRLSETLRGYGYAVLLDTVKSDVGTLHRVRVGPYGSESEAGAVVARLQTQVGDIKPRIMDLQPEKISQVTQPSDPLVRWIVQVGSFSSAANADKLVARLKLESLAAYKEEVRGSESTIYRVRIGPFLQREEAIRVDKLVTDRLSIDGVVMSAD